MVVQFIKTKNKIKVYSESTNILGWNWFGYSGCIRHSSWIDKYVFIPGALVEGFGQTTLEAVTKKLQEVNKNGRIV